MKLKIKVANVIWHVFPKAHTCSLLATSSLPCIDGSPGNVERELKNDRHAPFCANEPDALYRSYTGTSAA